MMSQIYYKFKSAKDYDNITFDGLGISVFDAKKEILTAKKLKGNDFDIVISHAESGEDYQEDTAIIPRNTPIVVRRVPTKPGKGTAHRYLEGAPTLSRNVATGNRVNYGNNGSMSKTFDSSKQQQQMQVSRPSPIPIQNSGEEQTEEDKIAAMFAQSSEFWEKTQEQMASKPALRRPNQPRPQVKQQIQKALPPNYVCYRCGQKGHWIQACPTNGDRSFDHMKVRKTTGIPRSFLQKVEQVPPGKGVLVTQDGNLVIAQANDAAWQKFHARQKSYVTTNEVLEDTFPVPPELQCMICARLLREAVITPCCRASFCDECIRNALINPEQEDQQFKCPNCRSPLLPDDLLPDKATREAVDNHLRDWARRRNEQIVPEGNGEDEAGINNSVNNVVVEESTIEMPITSETSIEKEQQRSSSSDFEQQLSNVKIEDKDKELNDHLDVQVDIAEDVASQTTTTTATQPPKVKTEPITKVELPKKPTHDLPQIPPQQQPASSQQSQLPQASQQSQQSQQQSSQFQPPPQQQIQRQQHQFLNANGKAFPQQNPAAAQQAAYGQFGYYNDYGFGYEGQYWYDDAGYPQMNMNMMNAPGGYYDPSYFESGFYPAEPFPAQPQFMPPFRPPVYDDFWDNRPMMPPQGNFTPFGNNMGMGGAMQPFRGGFRGGFPQRGGNFQNRGRGGNRGRGAGFFHEQRPFNGGRGNNNDFRRESSMGPSIGRREVSERPEYREGEPKYDDDRLVDDFGRDLARRKLSGSHHSPDKDIDPRDKLSPSLISDRDRRERDIIPDEDLESRRREKARSRSRSRSKERRSSSRSHHRSSRRHREGSHRSRSPSRHDRVLYDERRKGSTSSRRRSHSRDPFVERKEERKYVDDRRYYDDRRYSVSERREERRESMSDRRSDRDRDRRESLGDRRDDRRDSYSSSRYDSRRESIGDRKDSRRISMDERKDEIRNQGLSDERYEVAVKAETRTPSPSRVSNDESGKSLYRSPPQRDFDVEMLDEKNNQLESIEQNYEDNERQSRSESPRPIIDTEEFQVPDDDEVDNVIDVSTNDEDTLLVDDDDDVDTYPIKPTTPPSPPDRDHSPSSGKRRHSSSHKHRNSKYHRSSHHRRESLDEDYERKGSLSKSRHNTYSKDDYHRSGNRKHKKHHSSRHHSSRHHSSRSKDDESNRRRHYSRSRDRE